MRDQLIEEAAWLTLDVALLLRLLDLPLEMASSLVVDIVLLVIFVEVCFSELVSERKIGRKLGETYDSCRATKASVSASL